MEKTSRALAFGLLLSIGTAVIVQAVQVIRSEFTSLPARREVMRWLFDGEVVEATAWARARDQLSAARALAPDNAGLHDFLGSLYFVGALARIGGPDQRDAMLEAAIRHQEASLALLPHNSRGWAELAISQRMLNTDNRSVIAAWNRALTYGPFEAEVHRLLPGIALSIWKDAPPEMKGWVLQLYRSSGEAQRRDIDESAADFEVDLRREALGP